MLSHLNDSMHTEGDIIEFGVYKGDTFKHLVACAMRNNRTAYGIDSFKGLNDPTPLDWSENNTLAYPKGKFAVGKEVTVNTIGNFIKSPRNYKLIEGYIPDAVKLIPETSFAFAFVDLVHYVPTKESLNYLWDKMSYGSTIYFDNYFPSSQRLCSLAISQFIEEHNDEIIVSRQMLINGNREKQIAIKCIRQEVKPKNYIEPTSRPLAIALLLKTGGDYTHQHVNNLAKAIKKHVTVEHKLYCFTDDSTGIDLKYIDKLVPFKHNYPKWWGKIELFRPDVFDDEQVLYFDLDTFIVDNIDDIANFRGEFSALRDFYHLYSMGSGVMSWHGQKMHHVYNSFLPVDRKIMNNYREGDQRWIDEQKKSIDYMQDIFPSKVISYKVHCKANNAVATVPNNASVICFHGVPRPHAVTDPEIKKYWNP